jgi:ABC-type multidrug transport system fused ATPase/permease subunit
MTEVGIERGQVSLYRSIQAIEHIVEPFGGGNELAVAAINRIEGVAQHRADPLRDVGAVAGTVPAGTKTALVGETGAGKSTFAKLVSRFYDPQRGRVLVDGNDLRDLSSTCLRSQLGIVPQEGFLFSGTVRENIAFGRPDASDEEIEAAADAIGAGDFIRRMADGFDTEVGERGVSLSAGQRQLVSFARAFIAAPAVLVLDEATSLLDIPSERLVQEALHTILAGRTALIIAHRLSTVQIADRVIVIDRGQIIEDGPPAELLSRGEGQYSALYASWQQSLA